MPTNNPSSPPCPSPCQLLATQNASLPISSMPHEILCAIFRRYADASFCLHCVHETKPGGNLIANRGRSWASTSTTSSRCRPNVRGSRYWSLFTLSHVYSRWRNLILGSPILWSTVDIIHVADAEERLGTDSIPQLGACAFTATVDCELIIKRATYEHRLYAMDIFAESIVKYFDLHFSSKFNRVTSLDISLQPSFLCKIFRSLEDGVVTLPDLTSLRLHSNGIPSPWVPGTVWDNLRCPSLRKLVLHEVIIPPWTISDSPKLEVLHAELFDVEDAGTSRKLAVLLARSRATLQEVTLEGLEGPVVYGTLCRDILEFSNPPGVPILLERLRLLRVIWWDTADFADFLMAINAPNARFHLIHDGTVDDFVSCVSRYPTRRSARVDGPSTTYSLNYSGSAEWFDISLLQDQSTILDPAFGLKTSDDTRDDGDFDDLSLLLKATSVLQTDRGGSITTLRISITALFYNILECSSWFDFFDQAAGSEEDEIREMEQAITLFLEKWSALLKGLPNLESLELLKLTGKEPSTEVSSAIMRHVLSTSSPSSTQQNLSDCDSSGELLCPKLDTVHIELKPADKFSIRDQDSVVAMNTTVIECFHSIELLALGLSDRKERGIPIKRLGVTVFVNVENDGDHEAQNFNLESVKAILEKEIPNIRTLLQYHDGAFDVRVEAITYRTVL